MGLSLAATALTLAAATSTSTSPSPVAVAGSVFPGAVVHGTGSFLRGDPRGGRALLTLEGVGLVSTASGLTLLGVTGASRRFIAPAAALTAAGVSLFFASWLTDIYATATPDAARGAHLGIVPLLESRIGYRYVYDREFRYRNFVTEGFDLRLGAVRISPEAWMSPDDANQRLRGAVALRLAGPSVARQAFRAADGSFVDVEAALMRHAYPRDGFRYWGGEAMVTGRLDTARIAPGLRGAFGEASVGYALQSYEYGGGAAEADDLLLYRAACGAYLGTRGEAWLDYLHRHDDFAGGLLVPGIPSGILGSLGIGTRYFVTEELGFVLDARIGAATVTGASLVYRHFR